MPRTRSLILALAATVLGAVLAAPAAAADLYVDPSSPACSDAASRTTATAAATPWCSPAPATRLVQPGDTVHLAAGSYGQLRPAVSGTAAQPIVWQGGAGTVIAPPDGTVAVLLTGVHDLVLRSLTVRDDANQGIALDQADRIVLEGDDVRNAGGSGVWIKHATDTIVRGCTLAGNATSGLVDSEFASGTAVVNATVTGNGQDGQQFGGDGIELNGAGSTVRDSDISQNGDGAGFEHGIYVGATATAFSITGNRIGDNAGADIKAAGGPGVVAYNVLTTSRWGIVLSDNPAYVTVEYDLVQGRFQHGVFLTTGTTAARARLLNLTVEQTGRLTASGDASAVFVASATQLVLRNDLFAYTNADSLGSALLVNDATLLGAFDSQTNWFSATDRADRDLAWNGSRVDLAGWRARSHHDVSSIDTPPPAFDASGRVVSANLGAAAGTPLGLPHDLVGTPLPSGAPPDIGAYQAPGTVAPGRVRVARTGTRA